MLAKSDSCPTNDRVIISKPTLHSNNMHACQCPDARSCPSLTEASLSFQAPGQPEFQLVTEQHEFACPTLPDGWHEACEITRGSVREFGCADKDAREGVCVMMSQRRRKVLVALINGYNSLVSRS